MNRTQFTFYESFFNAIRRIKKKSDQADAYNILCQYALYGTEPDMDSLPKELAVAFMNSKDLLDFDIRQSIEGRRSIEYKKWRKSVFERDDYRCQVCGARGVKVNAHHRKEYAFYPELRYEIDNGVTLCVPCHKAVHRRRRRGD